MHYQGETGTGAFHPVGLSRLSLACGGRCCISGVRVGVCPWWPFPMPGLGSASTCAFTIFETLTRIPVLVSEGLYTVLSDGRHWVYLCPGGDPVRRFRSASFSGAFGSYRICKTFVKGPPLTTAVFGAVALGIGPAPPAALGLSVAGWCCLVPRGGLAA